MGRFFRRFCRYAFHLAAGFSVLALVACVILWPLSYHRYIYITYAPCGSEYMLAGAGGRLCVRHTCDSSAPVGFTCASVPFQQGSFSHWSYTDWEHGEVAFIPGTFVGALGCTWLHSPPVYSELAIPFLYLTLLAAILPAFWLRWFRRARQARRARPGFPVEPAAPAR